MAGVNVECQCGKSVPVEGLKTDLENEDWEPVKVTCSCGERYLVELRMSFLGKKKE